MRTRIISLVTALSLLLGTAAPVFAQGQVDRADFDWTFQRWLQVALASSLGSSPSPSASAEPGAVESPAPTARPRTRPRPTLPPEAIVVRNGPRTSGAVALTFDDGTNLRACAKIADTLRANDAVGTFFVNGGWLERRPAQWRDALRGMELGNHTRSHRNLADAPRGAIVRQIADNEAIHERVFRRPMLKVLRPPYGAQDRLVRQVAKELGYDVIVLWSRDTLDWRYDTSIDDIVRGATGLPAGSIVLMHCGRPATAKAMPRIVRWYKRHGIELAGLSTVLKGAEGTVSHGQVERYGGG